MTPTDPDPKDIDARLGAESSRLLSEMNALIERGRRLLRERERAAAATIEPARPVPGTLGAVLYARPSQDLVSEKDWVALLHLIAARDQVALHALHERSHEIICTLIERIVRDRQAAEDLALEALRDVWRQAVNYDPTSGTVLAWVMNLARARAIATLAGGGKPRRYPSVPARARLAHLIAEETAGELLLPPQSQWAEPAWEEVAPGISVKMLSSDTDRHMVSMLVRLAPGAEYPPHTHAGVEELHLLEGELWIDERKLFPGDYNRAEPGTGDKRVWSETGCACLLTTSARDILS